MSDAPAPRPQPRLSVILAVYLVFASVFAVIQPLGHLPDEPAHLQYIEFLATQHRLPVWAPRGGEAGYESQHPPLSYSLYVPAWWLLSTGGRLATVQGLRFVAIVVGLGWVLLCWGLFGRVFGATDPRRGQATAAVAWLPLTQLYVCHPNPDLVVAIAATGALWLAWETLRGATEAGAERSPAALTLADGADGGQPSRPEPSLRRAAALGAVLAAGCLTKLSAGAAVLMVVVAYVVAWRRAGAPRPAVLRAAGLTGLVFVVLLAPYLGRNEVLYGQWLVKTVAPYGSAWDHVVRGHFSAGQLLALTARQTYLSMWLQPDWIPGWPWRTPGGPDVPQVAVVLFYGAITAFVLAGLAGLRRGVEPAVRDLLWLGAALLVGVLVGHQAAFWTQDIEFNMGGRYVLSAYAAIAAALVAGLNRLPGGDRLPGAWLGLWLVLDAVAVLTILALLNPHYHPGWRILTLP